MIIGMDKEEKKILALDFSWRNVGYVIIKHTKTVSGLKIHNKDKIKDLGVLESKSRPKRSKSKSILKDIEHEREVYWSWS